MTSYVGVVEQARGLAQRERSLGRGGEAYDQLADYIERLREALTAAQEVVAQARNVSPRICGAAMVLEEKVKAYDAVLGRMPQGALG